MKVVDFKHPTMEDALRAVDQLRKDIEEKHVVAFLAVGVGPTDTVTAYGGSSQTVTRLRTMGALAELQHAVHSGEF